VRVITVCRRDAGVPIARFVHPRWTSLVRALAAADAGVYYHNCAEYVTGQVALWCRLHGRRFVYSVASDPECDPALPALRHLRERVLFRYGLRHADRIIVQTELQRRMLERGFGLPSVALPMPCAGPSPEAYRAPRLPGSGRPRVIWVGRLSLEKQPGWLAAIAAALPQVDFDVAGAEDPSMADAIARLRALPNVTLRGRVPRERMPEIYRDAAALLCTSAYEGFPNTFLEAWSHGVPVVSTVDPDGLIGSLGLGAVAATPAALTEALAGLLSSPDRWRRASQTARDAFLRRFTPESALPAFESVFTDVLQRPTEAPAHA
jgi:glycosyltransferase involved in cell wall biosynthesis